MCFGTMLAFRVWDGSCKMLDISEQLREASGKHTRSITEVAALLKHNEDGKKPGEEEGSGTEVFMSEIGLGTKGSSAAVRTGGEKENCRAS